MLISSFLLSTTLLWSKKSPYKVSCFPFYRIFSFARVFYELVSKCQLYSIYKLWILLFRDLFNCAIWVQLILASSWAVEIVLRYSSDGRWLLNMLEKWHNEKFLWKIFQHLKGPIIHFRAKCDNLTFFSTSSIYMMCTIILFL